MKFSTGVPNCREGRLNPIGSVDPAWMSDVAQAAEQLGYYSLWLNEFLETEPNVRARFDDPPNYYDALTTLGYPAAQTRRIPFLPSVVVLPLHHPILLNRQAATLDVLSGGRLTLGVGLGGSREDYRRLRGELGAVNRGQMMDEFVQALQALWSEQKASFSGRFVDFRDVHCFPKPRQDPLPLFMAGEADAVLRRIGRFAQGWIDSFSPPDSMRQIIGQLRHYTREARGTDAPIEIALVLHQSGRDARSGAGEPRGLAAERQADAGHPPPRGGRSDADRHVDGDRRTSARICRDRRH